MPSKHRSAHVSISKLLQLFVLSVLSTQEMQLRTEMKLPETTLIFSGSRRAKYGNSGKLVVGGAY